MKNRGILGIVALSAAALLTLSACSSGGSGSATGTDTGTDTGSPAADVAAATAALQPIIDAPSAFPIEDPLATSVAGKRIAIIDCGTPACAMFGDLAKPAVEQLGVEATVIQSGQSADGIANAFDTILAGGYDGVFMSGIAYPLWKAKGEQLAEAGIPVAATGITGIDPAVGISLGGDQQSKRAGSFLADWTIMHADGPVDSVIYQTPELPFSVVIAESYVERMAELCAECTARITDIPVTAIGSSAASIVIDDLSAHPESKIAAFTIGEQALGLPQAMRTAGITDVATVVNGPAPAQLSDLQNGDLTAALAADWPVLVWSSIDTLARLMAGDPVTAGATNDLVVQQMLTGEQITGDVSRGWSGYPDFAERFIGLWSQAA